MKLLRHLRLSLFAATGLAIPFYAFPVATAFGRPVDLATILAGLFIVSSLPALFARSPLSRSEMLVVSAAAAVPLLVLLLPRPEGFDAQAFSISWLHWVLVVAFFLCGLLLDLSTAQKWNLILANLLLGALVALFALYQVVGIPRGWPASSDRLFSFQREPFRFSRIEGTDLAGGYTRPTSVFLEPAWMGGYLAWVLALGLGLWRSGPRRPRETVAFWVGGGVILAALLASVSWGAYADTAIVVFATVAGVLLSGGFRPGSLRAVALGSVLLIGVFLLTSPGREIGGALLRRWQMLAETPIDAPETSPRIRDSSWIRMRNASHALELWRAHPVGGIGLGQFGRYAPPRAAETQEGLARTAPWCGWLTIGAEVGLLGPAVLASMIVVVLARWRRNRSGSFASVVPVLAALAAVQQLHTGSYIDLWWWFPLGVASVLSGSPR